MALFRRRTAEPDPTAGIESFWAWWRDAGAAECDAAITAGTPERLVEGISRRVEAIHRGLSWELAPGAASHHRLVVTAGGDPALRAVARRWLRAAPAPDETWEYADLRQPAEDLSGASVTVNGSTVGFDEVLITARRSGHGYDVGVFHDVFGGLADGDRLQLAFLALDAAIGEEGVETWVREITAPAQRPLDAFPLHHLPALVGQLAEECRDEHGEPTWALLRGEGPDGPVVVLARSVLASAQAPDLDTHVAVEVPYAQQTPERFPGPEALTALRQLEDHLVARLGGGGMLLAHLTGSGVRTLHFYVDGAGPGEPVLSAAVAGWPDGPVRVSAEPDPGWQAVAPFRT